jgi:hypothetical protein
MTKTPKRPRDTNQLAKFVIDAATGGIAKNEQHSVPARAASGAAGGKSRALNMTPDQRTEAAKLAAQARWRRKGD